jgi:S-DNA-T family DNA segregation ATPase FtsK/SpoIIIE
VVQKGLKRGKGVPVAGISATGIARLAARALWYATGYTARPKPTRTTVRASADPLNSQTAMDLRAAFVKNVLDVALVGATMGPSIIRYELKLGPTGSVKKIEGALRELALAVGTSDIRIVSPLRKNVIGLEVPREKRQIVTLDAVFRKATDTHPLVAALGLDVNGDGVLCRLDKMPHLLIAGTTGSGKSSCLNAILVSLIRNNTPDTLRLLLIDPKKVELTLYAALPHLVCEIVTDAARSVLALQWACDEMDRRYDTLSAAGVKTRDQYNEKNPDSPMPYLVVVVDELADLMLVSGGEGGDAETAIIRLTQLARAAGIHLVLATQRPSVDVVTGLIKSNMPSRLAFAASSGTDSKVILDQPGAEKLLGNGDGLYSPIGCRAPIRIQGALVEDKEVTQAVAAARGNRTAEERVTIEKPKPVDPMLDRAIAVVIRAKAGSTSLLQKELRIGHPKASQLIDAMEKLGVIGPAVKGKARTVLAEYEGA